MRVLTLEGNRQKLDGGGMFGHVPRAMWEKWYPPDASNRIELACRTLFIETDAGKKYLFDVGVGLYFDEKLRARYGISGDTHQLLDALKENNINQDEIDAVILSHLHFDHAGGVINPTGGLFFPNAKYYVGKKHWERACHPHRRDRASFIPELPALLEKSNRLVLLNKDTHPDLPTLTFSYTEGHTPGLLISEIKWEGKPLIFMSDLAPGMPWVHLPVTMGYDRFAERAVEEKEKLFTKWTKEGEAVVCFVHDPNVALATLKREGEKFIATPVQ